MNLDNAILKTLAYSDIFDHPLTVQELHRFLIYAACEDEIASCLKGLDLARYKDGHYYLAGREEIVDIHKYRVSVSGRAFIRAQRYGRILGRLPFVRMVALTGSLAMRNCDPSGDYDYMLVAARGRVWTARILALAVNKIANLFGETLCPNLIVSEDALAWKVHNLYSAREIAQMVLISGQAVFNDLRVVNQWVAAYLPNWNAEQNMVVDKKRSILQQIIEFLLAGRWGGQFEAWEMQRKIRKFSQQEGFGVETNFNAEVCQGNFDHHGIGTLQKYQQRLRALDLLT